MEIQVFKNPEFGQIRAMEIDGEPWFVGKDVAVMLGYSNPRKAVADHIDAEDKTDGVTIRDSIGRDQNPVCINESGLYSSYISFVKGETNMKECKPKICEALLNALKLTNACSNLESLVYDGYFETVTAKFSGGATLTINVNMDSGIALINDVLRGLTSY